MMARKNNYRIIQLDDNNEEIRRFTCRSQLLTYLKSIGGLDEDCDYLSAISTDSVGKVEIDEEIHLFEKFMEQWQYGAAGIQQLLNNIADAAKNNSKYLGIKYCNW